MVPPELVNGIKTPTVTHNQHGDLRRCLQDENWAGWPPKPVGRAPRLDDRVLAPPTFIFDVSSHDWMLKSIQRPRLHHAKKEVVAPLYK